MTFVEFRELLNHIQKHHRFGREKELDQQKDKKGEFEAILREARCKATSKHMSDFLRVRGYEVDKRMDL